MYSVRRACLLPVLQRFRLAIESRATIRGMRLLTCLVLAGYEPLATAVRSGRPMASVENIS
jgi:hypothetical protein